MKKNNCFGACAEFYIAKIYGENVKVNTNPRREGLTYEQQEKRLIRKLGKKGYGVIRFPLTATKPESVWSAKATYIALCDNFGGGGHAVVCERDRIIYDPTNAYRKRIFWPSDALVIIKHPKKREAQND